MLKHLSIAACIVVAASGCGNEPQDTQARDGEPMHGPYESKQPARSMTPEEKAVLAFAEELYRGQDLRSASCEKVGFSPNGDLYECSLSDADGLETEPREWTIARSADGGISAALPDSY